MKIEAGHPVKLINAVGLEAYGLAEDMVGIANSVTTVEGTTYVFFMPKGITQSYVIEEHRLVVDEELLEAGVDMAAHIEEIESKEK